jgi:Na+/H+ antiporter NhaD/arsenite permease-like protein
LLTSLLPGLWTTLDGDGRPLWASLTLDIAPSLLGFALGGMAIMLAFSSGRFLEAIRQKGKDKSYLRKMMASFFHFCAVLTAATLVGFVSSFYVNKVVSFIGVLLSIYGLLLVIATASRIWHTARIFNAVSDYDPMAQER